MFGLTLFVLSKSCVYITTQMQSMQSSQENLNILFKGAFMQNAHKKVHSVR